MATKRGNTRAVSAGGKRAKRVAERATSDSGSYETRLEAAKQASLGQLLFKCSRLFNEQALRLASQRWGVPVRMAHTTLFPHIDLEGTRLTTLADRVGVSKQAVGQLVDDLVDFDLVERVPDPSDGRAQLVRFTERGRRGLLEGLEVLEELRGDLGRRLGNEQILRDLLTSLQSLLGALEARAEVTDP
ncbi:MAG: winged helix-turn-helix transcriptional regulator [Polyangiaceae bacterium]|nr:winged helix-turn-helix transcriptional regulator [Myxococcales bacterium]MCB9587869.1 winged helix-turn-helix transcriptional regulator [Polyangiaceae bacterium]MCB9608818.1 winged helix-turn-helix transcriptional regulator [Polyangiaceae bacterium]